MNMICGNCQCECVRNGPTQKRCGSCSKTIRAEQVRKRVREWAAKNPEKAKALAQKWYENNKAKAIARAQKWNTDNQYRRRETNRASAKRCRIADPAKFAEAKVKRRQKPGARLHDSCSAAIRTSLRGSKCGASWERLVGYNVVQLKAHLEPKFTIGMSWENYGEWHIDHIRPVSSFSFLLAKDKDFIDCWSLGNLQPLWAADNIRKNNKWDGSIKPAPIKEQHLGKE